MKRWLGVVSCMAGVAATAAASDDLFTITATGSSPTVTVGNSRMLDLVSDAVKTRNQFSGFQALDASFALNYGGVPNAIIITKNAANTQATVTLGPTGVTRIFNGANQQELDDLIHSYLKTEGRDDLKDFYRAIDRLSRVAVSDGNPSSTTARSAQNAYDRFGWRGNELGRYTVTPEGGRDGIGLQMDVGVDSDWYTAGGFSGGSVTGTIAVNYFFTEHIGLSLGSYLTLQSVEDSDTTHFGTTFGVPFRPVVQKGSTGLEWQLTPFISDAEGASIDMAVGGALTGVGGTNYLGWTPTPKFTIAMANQISYYKSRRLSFGGGDYDLDPGVSQTILKNGLRATYRFNEAWSMYGGATVTDYLQEAAVTDWVTPEIGVLWELNKRGSGFLFGVNADLGADYSRVGGRFMFRWAF